MPPVARHGVSCTSFLPVFGTVSFQTSVPLIPKYAVGSEEFTYLFRSSLIHRGFGMILSTL